MLDDDGRVCDERPEVVGEKSRVSLKMGEESRRIGVVVRILGKNQTSLPTRSSSQQLISYTRLFHP